MFDEPDVPLAALDDLNPPTHGRLPLLPTVRSWLSTLPEGAPGANDHSGPEAGASTPTVGGEASFRFPGSHRLRLTRSCRISSEVVMTRELAWKPRWATIRLVNSWARSTLRHLEGAARERAAAALAGDADLGRARVGGAGVERAAGLLQTGRVGERRQRDLAERLARAVGEHAGDQAAGADVNDSSEPSAEPSWRPCRPCPPPANWVSGRVVVPSATCTLAPNACPRAVQRGRAEGGGGGGRRRSCCPRRT